RAAGRGRAAGRALRGGPQRRRLRDQPAARRPDRRPRVAGLGVRGRAAGAAARRAGAAAGAASVLLEEREVGAVARASARRPSRLLGGQRLPRPRGPVAGTALPRGLSGGSAGRQPPGRSLPWRTAT